MIIRLLTDGQYELEAAVLDQLNVHDAEVAAAVEAADQEALTTALSAMAALVRSGRRLADDELVDSDVIVPDETASLTEVAALLDESTDGLIPG